MYSFWELCVCTASAQVCDPEQDIDIPRPQQGTENEGEYGKPGNRKKILVLMWVCMSDVWLIDWKRLLWTDEPLL